MRPVSKAETNFKIICSHAVPVRNDMPEPFSFLVMSKRLGD